MKNSTSARQGQVITLGIALILVILLSRLPMWPLWVEGQQFTESGESLYHSWQYVSMIEFFDSYIYVQNAWDDSTTVAYAVLFAINSVFLVSFSWFAASWLRRKLVRDS